MRTFICIAVAVFASVSFANDSQPCVTSYRQQYNNYARMLEGGHPLLVIRNYVDPSFRDAEQLYEIYIDAIAGVEENSPTLSEMIRLVGMGANSEPLIRAEIVRQMESGELCRRNHSTLNLRTAAKRIREKLNR